MTAAEDLAAAPDPWTVPPDDEARQAYRIASDGEAAWGMRKLRDAERRRAEIRRIAEDEIDRIQRWAVDADRPPGRDAAFFQGLLIRWALDLRAADPQRKSVTTPYGTVQTRTTGGTWDVDEATVIAWARTARPDLVKTEESLRLGEAKKAFDVVDGKAVDPVPGEFVPGVTVGPESVTATVSVDLGGES